MKSQWWALALLVGYGSLGWLGNAFAAEAAKALRAG
jgi:hypothetical protein